MFGSPTEIVGTLLEGVVDSINYICCPGRESMRGLYKLKNRGRLVRPVNEIDGLNKDAGDGSNKDTSGGSNKDTSDGSNKDTSGEKDKKYVAAGTSKTNSPPDASNNSHNASNNRPNSSAAQKKLFGAAQVENGNPPHNSAQPSQNPTQSPSKSPEHPPSPNPAPKKSKRARKKFIPSRKGIYSDSEEEIDNSDKYTANQLDEDTEEELLRAFYDEDPQKLIEAEDEKMRIAIDEYIDKVMVPQKGKRKGVWWWYKSTDSENKDVKIESRNASKDNSTGGNAKDDSIPTAKEVELGLEARALKYFLRTRLIQEGNRNKDGQPKGDRFKNLWRQPVKHTYFNLCSRCYCEDKGFREQILFLKDDSQHPAICGFCRLEGSLTRFEQNIRATHNITEVLACVFDKRKFAAPLLKFMGGNDLMALIMQIRDYECIHYFLCGVNMRNRISIVPLDYKSIYRTRGLERVYIETFAIDFERTVELRENIGDLLLDIFMVPASDVFFGGGSVNITEGHLSDALYFHFDVTGNRRTDTIDTKANEGGFTKYSRDILWKGRTKRPYLKEDANKMKLKMHFLCDLIVRPLSTKTSKSRLSCIIDERDLALQNTMDDPTNASAPTYFVLKNKVHSEEHMKNKIHWDNVKKSARLDEKRADESHPMEERAIKREEKNTMVWPPEMYAFRPYGPAMLISKNTAFSAGANASSVDSISSSDGKKGILLPLAIISISLFLNLIVHLIRKRHNSNRK